MSLVYIKDYLEELDKGISEKEWFLKNENKRIRDRLERSIKYFESQNKLIDEVMERESNQSMKINELNKKIAYLYTYINLKEEYKQQEDSYYGTCCSNCDGDCHSFLDNSEETRIDLELKEQSLKYLEDIIYKAKNKEKK